MSISTKRASQLRLGIRWAYRDAETRKLNNQLRMGFKLPMVGLTKVKEQSRATQKAYHRTSAVLLVSELHGIIHTQVRPHLGDEQTDQLLDMLQPRSNRAQQLCEQCGDIRAMHGSDRVKGGLGCLKMRWDADLGKRVSCFCPHFVEPKP